MNTGVVSKRYAVALLKYVSSTGNGEAVYNQVRQLLQDPDRAPQPLYEDLQKFITLLIQNGRISFSKLILHSFISLYDQAHDIHSARLVTAVDSPVLQEKLCKTISSKIGGDIHFDVSTDPSLIGGFVLEVDGYRMDASVSKQLEDIERQFISKNKRIV